MPWEARTQDLAVTLSGLGTGGSGADCCFATQGGWLAGQWYFIATEKQPRNNGAGNVDSEVVTRLDRIESLLAALLSAETIKDYYSTDEFARLLGKAEFTVREWARLGRIHALKRHSGRVLIPPG